MASLQWLLDLAVAVLLAATLFHAMRLQRALAVLKRDRGALDEVMRHFEASTRAAEAGIERFRQISEGAGQQIERQGELGAALKDDLAFLIERGDRLADRLDALVRTARPIAAEPARPPLEPLAAAEPPQAGQGRPRSQAERDLLAALRGPR